MNVTVADGSVHIAEVARRFAPHLHVVAIAQPEPVLRELNVVTMVPGTEDARDSVLSLEAIEADDAAIGVVVMGTEPVVEDPQTVDPDGIVASGAPRIMMGGLVAAAVGAILVGGLAAVLSDGPGVIGAVLAGAALFGPFGAIWAVFGRLGDSADREALVEPQAADVTVVSYHTDDDDEADAGFERLRAHGHRNVVILDASGAHVLRRNDAS